MMDKIGKQKILIVDDEPSILKMLADMIKILGYESYQASNGMDAVEIFQQHADEIAIVFLDILMPKMNGFQVYEEIKKINPDVKVVVISGYTNEPEILNFIAQNKLRFFRKPFHIEDVVDAIKKILETK
jgi:DNA-binding NtrC family response regulator